jgi:opacity protein-like surface antigen
MPVAPRRAFASLALSAAAVALAAAPAAAQGPVNPVSFGLSAGAAIPTGDFGDAANTGFSVDGIIALRTPTSPVGFRGEVGYTRFGLKGSDDVNLRLISGVANLVLPFSAAPTAVVRPYVIAGVGAYNGKFTVDDVDDDDSDSETNIGLNAGFGVEIPLSGITGFGEVRFTSVFTKGEGSNLNFVPIRFGIRF